MTDHHNAIQAEIFKMLEALSGTEPDASQPETTFVEMGFDSLFLGQLATEIRKKWQVKLAFRQLLREFPSPAALASHLIALVPAEKTSAPVAAQTEPSTGVAVDILRGAPVTAVPVAQAAAPVVIPQTPTSTASPAAAPSAAGALENSARSVGDDAKCAVATIVPAAGQRRRSGIGDNSRGGLGAGCTFAPQPSANVGRATTADTDVPQPQSSEGQ
ncbi:MAG: acyl carrier protein [Hyphomicrobiaceae bacterium]